MMYFVKGLLVRLLVGLLVRLLVKGLLVLKGLLV